MPSALGGETTNGRPPRSWCERPKCAASRRTPATSGPPCDRGVDDYVRQPAGGRHHRNRQLAGGDRAAKANAQRAGCRCTSRLPTQPNSKAGDRFNTVKTGRSATCSSRTKIPAAITTGAAAGHETDCRGSYSSSAATTSMASAAIAPSGGAAVDGRIPLRHLVIGPQRNHLGHIRSGLVIWSV